MAVKADSKNGATVWLDSEYPWAIRREFWSIGLRPGSRLPWYVGNGVPEFMSCSRVRYTSWAMW